MVSPHWQSVLGIREGKNSDFPADGNAGLRMQNADNGCDITQVGQFEEFANHVRRAGKRRERLI